MSIEVPVLLVVFNRPDITKKIVDKLREFEIKELYVFADGPRKNNIEDLNKCQKVRETINNDINWECKKTTNFKNKNYGCGHAMVSAISWFFEQVEAGIILEDDINPNYSFFRFCAELLSRYKYNKKIMHITGLNWQNGKKRGDASYYFSYYPGIWGWATWKDRWQLFNHELRGIDEYRENNKIQEITTSKEEQEHHLKTFDKIKKDKNNIWSYAWKYVIFKNKGLCIWPNKNLTANIGFGENATHTKSDNHPRFNCPTYELDFPLKHPNSIKRNIKADKFMARRMFNAKFRGDVILNYLRKCKHKMFKR